jgi:hypothetical protein
MIYTKFGFTIIFHDDEVDTSQFDELNQREFLGLMLHGQQQGVNDVRYNGYQIEAVSINDCNGYAVRPDMMIRISNIMTYARLMEIITKGSYG